MMHDLDFNNHQSHTNRDVFNGKGATCHTPSMLMDHPNAKCIDKKVRVMY